MIVGIESASTYLGVALAKPDGTLIDNASWESQQRQSAELLPRLLALCESHGSSLREASAVVVGTGPGSFTGLRVGMSLAKGLARALRIPILGIPSLPAWLDAVPECSAALSRAGAREAYLLIRGEVTATVVDRDALPDAVRGAPVAAPGELAEAFGLASARPPAGAAAALARVAAASLAAHPEGDDLATLEPAYLRLPRGVGPISSGEVRAWP